MKIKFLKTTLLASTLVFANCGKKEKNKASSTSKVAVTKKISRSIEDVNDHICYTLSTAYTKLAAEYYDSKEELKKEFVDYIDRNHQKEFKSGQFKNIESCENYDAVSRCDVSEEELVENEEYEYGYKAIILFTGNDLGVHKDQCMRQKKKGRKVTFSVIKLNRT